MTVTVSNTLTTDSFQLWLTHTNELAYAMTNKVLTVDSNTTNGNATLNGTFNVNYITTNNSITIGNSISNTVVNQSNVIAKDIYVSNGVMANGFAANGLVIGSSSANVIINSNSITLSNSSINFTLRLPTSSQYSNTQTFLLANGSWAALAASPVSNGQYYTSGTSPTVVDSFLKTDYNIVEYVIGVQDITANNIYGSKILIVHAGGNPLITEYAALVTNSNIGVFSAEANTTHVQLVFTPSTSSCSVKFTRITV